VFSIGGLTRHQEITAAKASGISFYRMIMPIVFGAFLATLLGLVIAEIKPPFNAKRNHLLRADATRSGSERFNFAYAGEFGRVYKVGALNVAQRRIDGFEIERKGKNRDYPTYVYTAQSGVYDTTSRRWRFDRGELHLLPDSTTDVAFAYDSIRDNRVTEQPKQLTAAAKDPGDMGFKELGAYIKAMELSGADVNTLRVTRMLNITIPVTCLVILLFGAPLATSNQRGGAAYGVGVSLGTTIVFLMLIQLTKAIGGKGLIQPEIAAWVPSVLFAVVGAWLLSRVRT
jgi:lipopolysaccharide export system permease protein